MQCKNVLTRIDALRTGELEHEQHQNIEEHLEVCGSCRESLEDVGELASRVKQLSVSPSRSCRDSLQKRLCHCFERIDTGGRTAWIVFSSAGIRMIDLSGGDEAELRRKYCHRTGKELMSGTMPVEMRKAVEAALRGEGSVLPHVDLEGLSEFEQRVLRTITTIPRGEVRSYEWVARAAGNPQAVRAVGNIMAKNPIPLLLPCHRVVPAAGGLGRYAFGTPLKRSLLEEEGAPVDDLETLAQRHVRFIGSATTKIFCFPTCRDAQRIRPENRVSFHNAEEAGKRGFRPCKRCLPVAVGA